MGLIPLSEVEDIVYFEDVTQSTDDLNNRCSDGEPCPIFHSTSKKTLSIAQLEQNFGKRDPDFFQSQKSFNAMVMMISKTDLTQSEIVDLSNDDIAKMHIRYMVGGHAPQVDNELVYRFEFPERSGALLHFLSEMGENWNISLFHYRNHGAAYGRVLMGFQVKEEEREKFQNFINKLGIPCWDESGNSAYKKFLS